MHIRYGSCGIKTGNTNNNYIQNFGKYCSNGYFFLKIKSLHGREMVKEKK